MNMQESSQGLHWLLNHTPSLEGGTGLLLLQHPKPSVKNSVQTICGFSSLSFVVLFGWCSVPFSLFKLGKAVFGHCLHFSSQTLP